MNRMIRIVVTIVFLAAEIMAMQKFQLGHLDLARKASLHEIVPDLYLGNAAAACDRRLLSYLNMTHILTIQARRLPKSAHRDLNITCMFVKAHDSPDTYLLPYFPLTNKFIDEGIGRGKVLVHCHYGVSRSATLVIAFLMRKYEMSFERAFSYVKYKRKFINPNHGFIIQLKEYERMGYDVYGFNKWSAYIKMQARNYKCKLASVVALILESSKEEHPKPETHKHTEEFRHKESGSLSRCPQRSQRSPGFASRSNDSLKFIFSARNAWPDAPHGEADDDRGRHPPTRCCTNACEQDR
ncbi:Dual specificity protein phosphatase MPK-4 [Eumeta japonica]|uniref:protein-tyrosine-phosphatase n=1 Tax=Eumeta variegata TaxID=151549 RepID=A0A4C1SE65_EUMVA|nr:Dual specificity protein phosphatase MPK-4 [Eumeta japonica]